MRRYLVLTSLFVLSALAGCQTTPMQYSGQCSQSAQDAGLCTAPSYGTTLNALGRP
jgi:hypothetical protein